MPRLIVDTTLPPQQFQDALIKAARKARAEAKAIVETQKQFERIGWKPEAAYELACLHVRGTDQ